MNDSREFLILEDLRNEAYLLDIEDLDSFNVLPK